MVQNLPAMQETQVRSLDKKRQPTAVFLPEEFHGRGAWQVTVHVEAKESDRT